MITAQPRVLIVDDQFSMASMLADGLLAHGFQTVPVASFVEASRRLREESFDALVTDLRMPDNDGMALLALSRSLAPHRPVIIMTAFSAVESAIESIRSGAYHYLTKPFKVDELAIFLARALEESQLRRETLALRRALRENFSLANVVAVSQPMREVCDMVERIADADVPVLLTGETGTGKGVIARAIHGHGRRASGPFVTVNCAALPEALLETELFGHVKGAFTGATANRPGLFLEAHGGTLLLDEIAELALPLQAKLLDVIERKQVRAVGSSQEREVDVRVIAATHRDLHRAAALGRFRQDLLYRLNVIAIELPALRHRPDDLPVLIDHFLLRAQQRHTRSRVTRVGSDAMKRLLEHAWPGNVRELEHTIERLVLLGGGEEVRADELPASIGMKVPTSVLFQGAVLPMREIQRRYAAWAFEQLRGQRLVTAERLGIDVKTLRKWLADDPGDPTPRSEPHPPSSEDEEGKFPA